MGQASNRSAARPRRITHRDVALRAGVSTAVVSYVINDGPRSTSQQTRARVLEAIAALDYHPNAMARGLRAQRTQTIGFIDSDYSPLDVFVSPYSAGLLTGLAAELRSQDYYLLIYPHKVGHDLASLARMLRSGRLDGVVVRLVEDSGASAALLEAILAARVPCVCLERPADARFGFGAVMFDDERGAFEATRYLIERGHRRIGHLRGDPRYASAQARAAGYRRALVAAGLAIDPDLIQGEEWTPLAVDVGVSRLLALPEPPTALFAANDSLAFRAIEVLRAAGRRVPDDVAVVGFDDIPLAREMVPPLTTVRIPLS